MISRMKHKLGLSLFFSLAVFIIFIITAIILALISYILIAGGMATPLEHRGPFPMVVILMISSIIVGTIVSFFLGSLPLKPLRAIISATNKLASGDFSTRLEKVKGRPPELNELVDSFNRMAQELGSLETARNDFINNFSHEFKTPIVSIKGFAEMLKSDQLTQEERVEYINIIISESKRLAALATNVLNLSKVENQVILTQRQPFNLTEQIRRCLVMLESRWEEKSIDLNIELDELSYAGNEELLSQVWLNLIDNAIKFTPNGGSVFVSLRCAPKEICFRILDSGCGIGQEAAKHIFDKFYRAQNALDTTGNGLGLALAERIVALHGGTTVCNSEENIGTEFVVKLPV